MSNAVVRLDHDPLEALGAFGFRYRNQEEIDRRRKVLDAFELIARALQSNAIEVPLASPVSDFIGAPPRPLGPKNIRRLFTSITPEGVPCAIRYEGTALTAKLFAKELLAGSPDRKRRFHYFQEMLRVELPDELDARHFRSFYQAGAEFFALDEQQHMKDWFDLIELITRFLFQLTLRPKIRISHVDLLRIPIRQLGQLDSYDHKRLVTLFEAEDRDGVKGLVRGWGIQDAQAQPILDLIAIGRVGLDEGVRWMHQQAWLYGTLAQRFELLRLGLESRGILELCELDPGIARSLDFYSGFTLQGDAGAFKECLGGGVFSGLVESFGAPCKVFAVGCAFGVERVLSALDQRKREKNGSKNYL